MLLVYHGFTERRHFYMKVIVKFASKPAFRFLNFRCADYTEIGMLLASINWKTLLSQSLDVNDMWLRVSENINFVINENFPRSKF